MGSFALPEIGSLIGGRYRVDRVLGRGGMGIVYAATDTELDLNLPVAIKWLLPEWVREPKAVERFLQEARCAAAIRHPNVVTIFSIGTAGAPYIVMELLEGQSLAQKMLEQRRAETPFLPPAEACALLLPVLRGVQAAHEASLPSPDAAASQSVRGIVHRDLKPDNVFLAIHGGEVVPKVLDFGIAKPADRIGTSNNTLTGDGAFPGTPGYMAPEQLFDPTRIGPWTDVYALGVILYEMLAGEAPFSGGTPIDIAMKVGQGQYPPLGERVRGISDALERVVQRAMAREIEERYPDIGSFEQDLKRYLDPRAQANAPVTSSRPPSTAANADPASRTPQPTEFEVALRGSKSGGRRAWLAGLGGLLAIGIGFALWSASRTRSSVPNEGAAQGAGHAATAVAAPAQEAVDSSASESAPVASPSERKERTLDPAAEANAGWETPVVPSADDAGAVPKGATPAAGLRRNEASAASRDEARRRVREAREARRRRRAAERRQPARRGQEDSPQRRQVQQVQDPDVSSRQQAEDDVRYRAGKLRADEF